MCALRVRVSGIPEGFTELQYSNGELTTNYVVGPDNGLPLLLIPGQMESWQGYKLVMSELSRRFHIFVPDQRGHGKSSRTPGQYSYNICGEDLKDFIRNVIREPAIVSGLSSGGVLAIWLGAYASEDVLAVIGEDPPIFSSVWPRIREEKFMSRNFEIAIQALDRPEGRNLEMYYSLMGAPKEGESELMLIPPAFVKLVMFLYRTNRKLRPDMPYDPPFLPLFMRLSFKYFSEYDIDFSRATIDGRLSEGFDPEDALRSIRCPMLLLRANASQHETWGLLGAISDDDLARVQELVTDLEYVQIPGRHDLHVDKPEEYIAVVNRFVDGLVTNGKLPA